MEDLIIHDFEVLDDVPERPQTCPCPFAIEIAKMLGIGKMDKRFDDFQIGDWIDNSEVMKKFNISKKTLQNWRDDGILPYSKFGRLILYHKDDIGRIFKENFVRQNTNGHGNKSD